MVIGFCYISIILCWISFFSRFLHYFRLFCVVFSLCFLYGRPFFFFFFFCFGVSSHWESPVLGILTLRVFRLCVCDAMVESRGSFFTEVHYHDGQTEYNSKKDS